MVFVIRGGAGMGAGSWFDENLRRVVGGGGNTYFWTDNWVNDASLRMQFPLLFDLAENKWVTVEEMLRGGWEEGGG